MFCPEINSEFDYDQNFIKINSMEVLGDLPNPFIMNDGSVVDTAEKWQERRKEIYKTAVELQYGTIPPKPEVLQVEKLYESDVDGSYKIICGTKEKQISFRMKVIRPSKEKNPVVVCGDACFHYMYESEYLDTYRKNKIAFAMFDRTELAHDVCGEGRRQGALYSVYPEYTFGAIGAWAWGFMRCVDALEIIGKDDMDLVAFSGHSRGAKTALLAGVLDERAKVVAPNSACAGSCGCYRIHTLQTGETGMERRSETLTDMIEVFPFWFGEGMADYVGREEDLPFDSHFLKALVAPRALVVTESASDGWANPVGSYVTTQGAKEVYKLLGAEDNLYWSYRKGFHFHKIIDIEMLVNVISHIRDGAPISDRFYRLPFKTPELNFSWRCPEKK